MKFVHPKIGYCKFIYFYILLKTNAFMPNLKITRKTVLKSYTDYYLENFNKTTSPKFNVNFNQMDDDFINEFKNDIVRKAAMKKVKILRFLIMTIYHLKMLVVMKKLKKNLNNVLIF